MDIGIWLTFVAASALLLIVPGPTVMLVAGHAVAHGRRVALSMAAGVALGDFVAMTASLLGLGALVAASATLFSVLKWVGAAYLVYLGLRLWRSAATVDVAALAVPREVTAGGLFGHAFVVTALNPKSIAFFIAFVPQFVQPGAPLLAQFAILVATFVVLAALNALAYAVLADRLRARIARPAVLRATTRASGAVLVAMGVLTATVRRGAT